VGALLSAWWRVPLVVDYRDPWAALQWDDRFPAWRRRLSKTLEKWCLHRCSLAVAATKGIRAELDALGPARSALVTNAFDLALVSGVAPTRYTCFTVVYAGTFYHTRTAEPVLRAMRTLIDAGGLPPAGMTLRVLGGSGPEVAALADSLGLSSYVEVEGVLPYREAVSRMKGADVLLLAVGEGHTRQIPAKLFDYLAARRFILALAPPGSEAGNIISDLGVGRVVDSSDIGSIARALSERIQAPRAELTLPAAAARYEAGATMRELDRLLREVLAASRRDPH
jgi:glycosyltransferase involved in cell wall biosynthesis